MPVTQGGTIYPFNMGVGLGQDASYAEPSMFAFLGGASSAAAADPIQGASAASAAPAKVSTLWYLIGAFVLIIAFKFAVEHEKSGMDFSFLGIGVYNFIAVGILAFLFIVSMKVVFNKYYVPGLTELINVT